MPRRRPAQAATIGVVAAALALGLDLAGLGSLDAPMHARWHRPTPPSGGVVVVSSAAGSDAADAVAMARLVSRLSRAGAAAIVLDSASPSPRSGAAGEALLRQTVTQAGNVGVALAPGSDGAAP